MAGWVAKLKSALDWLQHGYLIVNLLLAAGAGQLVKAGLLAWTRISPDWITPIWLLFAAAVLLILRKIWGSPQSKQAQGGGQRVTVLPAADVDEFYRNYDNGLLVEFEDDVRAQSAAYAQGATRENFLIRLLAVTRIRSIFDFVWLAIYRSQIKALEALNTRPHQVDELKAFYDEAVAQNPSAYERYSFNSWLAFMRSQVLINEQGDMVRISIRGREFLKNMVHLGRSAEDRRL